MVWFYKDLASVSPETGKIDPSIMTVGKHRNIRARKDLEGWLKKVDLPYHSSHKFRHSNAVYSLKNAKDVRNKIMYLGKDIDLKSFKNLTSWQLY